MGDVGDSGETAADFRDPDGRRNGKDGDEAPQFSKCSVAGVTSPGTSRGNSCGLCGRTGEMAGNSVLVVIAFPDANEPSFMEPTLKAETVPGALATEVKLPLGISAVEFLAR